MPKAPALTAFRCPHIVKLDMKNSSLTCSCSDAPHSITSRFGNGNAIRRHFSRYCMSADCSSCPAHRILRMMADAEEEQKRACRKWTAAGSFSMRKILVRENIRENTFFRQYQKCSFGNYPSGILHKSKKKQLKPKRFKLFAAWRRRRDSNP